MIAVATKHEQVQTGWHFARQVAERAEEAGISLLAAAQELDHERHLGLTVEQAIKAADLAEAVQKGEAPHA